MNNEFTGVFFKDGDWWVAYAEELPGANTQGRTLDEARENLKDAIAMILEANREVANQRTEGQGVIREPVLVSKR